MTTIGDNSGPVARDQLRAFVERVERLHEERKAIADDIKDVYTEAKANGFDPKAMKHVVKLRDQEPAARQEFEAIVDLYLHALGMLPDDDAFVQVHAHEESLNNFGSDVHSGDDQEITPTVTSNGGAHEVATQNVSGYGNGPDAVHNATNGAAGASPTVPVASDDDLVIPAIFDRKRNPNADPKWREGE